MVANEKWFTGAGASAGFYSHQILTSCRFDASASSRLYRTFGTSSDATKMTISWWMKYDIIPAYQQIFSKAGGFGAGNGASITFEDSLGGYSDVMTLYGMKGSSGGGTGSNTYPANAFRDVSGWTHCHYKMDTSKSGMTGNNAKVVLHINGVNATFVSTNEPSGNFDNFNTNGDEHSIGNGNGNTQGNIYLAEFIFLDGQYEDYTSFGEFKGGKIWVPKNPSGLTFGNNGFHLKFEAGAIGTDSSGNGNTFSTSGLSASSIVLDSPTFGS